MHRSPARPEIDAERPGEGHPRLLLVEDSADDAEILRAFLSATSPPPFDVEHVTTLAAARERLISGNGIDAVLLDLGLPDSWGLDTFLRARDDAPGVPLVVMTSLDDERLAVKAVQSGAQDYLVKGRVDRAGLLRALRHAIERQRLVTALREGEARLRQQAEFVSTLARSMGEGVYAIDREGRLTFLNPAAERLLGWSEEELRAKDVHDAIHRQRLDGARCVKEECALLGVARSGSVVERDDDLFVRRDGSTFPAAYNAAPMIEGGQITGAVIVFQDISERRQLEAQLRQAQKMEAVGRLAGGVAHDFNNVLGVIIGMAELLLDRSGDDKLRQGLSEIRHSAERAAALTARLLAFARKQIAQPRLLDLNATVNHMRSLLRPVIGEDVEVVALLEPNLGAVKVDPGQIEQAIMNLAVNARDAMPRGGRLTLSTRNATLGIAPTRPLVELTAGEYVVLSISDTGRGMDADTLDHVFEPFFTTKPPGEGTGIGLATVYAIVKGAGGGISVQSEPGRGSTFTIYLPRASGTSAARRPDSEAASRVPPARSGLTQGNETILLVEDEAPLRRLLTEMLAMKGYNVVSAEGPDEALRVARAHPGRLDLVITDVVMPGMNGREMAELLARFRPGVPVIYISGYTDDAVFQQGLLKLGSHFIGKPFTPTELWRCVRSVLESSAQPE